MEDHDLIEKASRYFKSGFDGVIRIETMDGKSSFWVDGRQTPPVVSAESPKGVEQGFCLWRAEKKDLQIIFGADPRRLESSYVSGRLKISGDMAVMARLELDHA